MPRNSGRNPLRQSIASVAARLMVEDGIEDYAQAKRKAARQVGAPDARLMPTNEQIDIELAAYRSLFQQDHSTHLHELRELALCIMRELSAFNPYLTGSVLSGSAGIYANIQLQLFCENLKTVEHYLLGKGVPFRTAETRLFAGDMPIVAPVLIFVRAGLDVHLTLLSPRELRASLRTAPSSKPINRAKAEAVAALLDEG